MARTQRAPAHPAPDRSPPEEGWPWDDFDDELHRWLEDPDAIEERVGWRDPADLQPVG